MNDSMKTNEQQVRKLCENPRSREKTTRILIDAAAESACLINSEGIVLVANTIAARRLGTTVGDLVGSCLYEVLPLEAAQHHRAIVDAAIRSGELQRVVEQEPDGRYYDQTVRPVFDDQEEVCCLAIYCQDVTDHKLAEAKVTREQELLRRLFDLHERERKLLSHEIHDGFVQDVVGAKMLLEATIARLESSHASVPGELCDTRDLLAKAISEARRMITELRPMIIDEHGLVDSINHLLAEEDSSKHHLRIEFHHDVHFDRLDPMLEGTVFRIAQEALTNVKRHSRSETVEIRLTQKAGWLYLEIRDQGVGFEPNRVPRGRFGLRGISERARLFGGRATIDATPGQGTRIHVELPLAGENQPDRDPISFRDP